jgi:hypothetical protein
MPKKMPRLAEMLESLEKERGGGLEAKGSVASKTPSPDSISPAAAEKKPAMVQAIRHGAKNVSGYFLPEVSKQLKLLALEKDMTLQEVMREAINDLFVKYDRSPMA